MKETLKTYKERALAFPKHEDRHLKSVIQLIKKRPSSRNEDIPLAALNEGSRQSVERQHVLSQPTKHPKGPLSPEKARKLLVQAVVLDFVQREVVERRKIVPIESMVREDFFSRK